MQQEILALLRELQAGLECMYGSRSCRLYLYGSHARGDQDQESDVDVLIILRDFQGYGDEIARTGDLIARLSLDHNVSISRVFVTEDDWLGAETPFLAAVRSEAIPA